MQRKPPYRSKFDKISLPKKIHIFSSHSIESSSRGAMKEDGKCSKSNTTDLKKALELIRAFCNKHNFKSTANELTKECQSINIELNTIDSNDVSYQYYQHKKLVITQSYDKIDDRIDDLPFKYNEMQVNYKRLLDVAVELTNLLHSNLEEEGRKVCEVLNRCRSLYPDLFRPVIKECVVETIIDEEKIDFINDGKIDSKKTPEFSNPQIEVRDILESVLSCVFQKNSDKMQEISAILDDIIEEATNLNSPRKKGCITNGGDTIFELKPDKSEVRTKFNKNKGNIMDSSTPLCYMEICRKLQSGLSTNCRCMKCLPGQSRYYCSCYDDICKEIDEDTLDFKLEKKENKNTFKNRKKLDEKCIFCNYFKCKCAFKSRPKLRRSPPV